MDRAQAAIGLAQLADYVQKRLPAARVQQARPWRCVELTRLVVRHWPCHHLRAVVSAGGRNHKSNAHAMALVLAQVHEQWEARHGMGPLWGLVLAQTVGDISTVLQDLWWSDERWRATLTGMAKYAADIPSAGGQEQD